jgi:hypothetical protein
VEAVSTAKVYLKILDKKVKQSRAGPEVSKRLRIPVFKTIGT